MAIRRRYRVHVLLGAFLALMLLLAVSACGGSDSTEASGSPSPTDVVVVKGIEVQMDAAAADLLPQKYRDEGIDILSCAPFAPYEYFDENNELVGLDIDVGKALAATLGIKSTVTSVNYDGVIPALQTGKYDMIISQMADSPDRQEMVDFVDYAEEGAAMVVQAGNPEGIVTGKDLAGKKLTYTAGWSKGYFDHLTKYFKDRGEEPPKLVILPATPDTLIAVQAGKADAAVVSTTIGKEMIAKQETLQGLEVITPKSSPAGWNPVNKGIAILKGNDELTAAVKAGMEAMLKAGVLAGLYDQYDLGFMLKDEITMNELIPEEGLLHE